MIRDSLFRVEVNVDLYSTKTQNTVVSLVELVPRVRKVLASTSNRVQELYVSSLTDKMLAGSAT